MSKLQFTKKALERIPAAEPGKRTYYQDKEVAGLQMAVTDRGTKTYYVYKKVQGRPLRVKLGHFPDLAPNKARSKAYKVLGSIAEGIDPHTQKKKKAAEKVTLMEILEEYLRVKPLKEKTKYEYRQTVTTALSKWLHKPIINITPERVARKHRKLTENSGPSYANAAMRNLRALYNFARNEYEDEKGRSLFYENPVRRLSQTRSWNRVNRKTTVIHAHQLPEWWEAVATLRKEPFGTSAHNVAEYLLVLLFTGLRRSEAAQLKRSDIDFDAQTLTVRDTKNHEVHVLPLTDFLHTLLKERFEAIDTEFIFPGQDGVGHLIEPRAQIQKVIQASNVHFTLHDLRRTFITIAEELGIPPYTLKRLLNHKMNNDVTAGYIISDVPRLKGPMQEITDKILKCANQTQPASVILLRKKS